MLDFIFFIISLLAVIKSADYAIRYSSFLAEGLKFSKYVIGFLLVAFISIIPEAFISISAAVQGVPAFGLGTLFGSNVADLTLVFAVVVFIASDHIKIESKIITNSLPYILIMFMPILFGLNGHYSRIEGLALVLIGISFYYLVLRREEKISIFDRTSFSWKHLLFLLISMFVLLLASNMTVKFGVALAGTFHINPVLVAMLFVGLGTTLPELFFSIRAVRNNHDSLAMGDILGTVVTDATILVGIVALINPFTFNQRIVYVTGMFMLVAAILLLFFMRTGKILTKKEGLFLLFYYLIFVLIEFMINSYFSP